MKAICLAGLGVAVLLAGCGPTAEEQHAMDVQRCGGFGFAPGTNGFANCMMTVNQQREAQNAADRRAAAARDAADQRTQAAARAAKDRADQDAWDKRTGQGAYSSSSPSSSSPNSSSFTGFGPSPTDAVRDSIQSDIDKINGEQ